MLPKHPWLKKCLEHLEKLPQVYVTATTELTLYLDILADGKLTLKIKNQQIDYIFLIKGEINENTWDKELQSLRHLNNILGNSYHHILLITNNLPDFFIEQLLRENIEFLDTNGTIYLNNNICYILVRNHVNNIQIPNFLNVLETNILKLAFILLQDPRRLKGFNQNCLAELSGLEPEAVSLSLENLYKLGYLDRLSKDKYLILDYKELFEYWHLGYIENFRPFLLIDVFRPLKSQNFSAITNKLIGTPIASQLLIGGELGAAILTKHLRPIGAVLHIPENKNYRQLMVDLRLVPDPQGNITFLHQFGKKNHYLSERQVGFIADPILIYTELMRVPDERLKETAQRIHVKYILPRQDQAKQLHQLIE